ncbi:MAG: M3 family oligoendopeptidase [Saprospiraceae bacterium]
MTFADFEYQRPDMEKLQGQFEELLNEFDAASAQDQIGLVHSIKVLRSQFSTQQSICHVRHTCDTTDAFYEAENAFFDEVGPQFEALVNRFNKLLVTSPRRATIQAEFGDQFIVRTEVGLRAFDPSTVDQLGEENQLASAYTKVKAQAQLAFKGETYNLSSIHPLMIDPDRTTRKGAWEATWKFYAKHGEELGDLYDQLVKKRTAIAQKMGHENFVALGYDRMSRTDYGPEEVARFRQEVKKHIVPLATELFEQQRERLGLEELMHYDEGISFPTGNPTPIGTPADTVEAASELYAEMSPETDQFFKMMREKGLMDLVGRDGKATGGYCTFLHKQSVPFIFSNFNGTSGDIDVLTHELGHAFQMYESRRQPVMEYILPTYEACEIHSMSMEFFAYPWMDGFFGDDSDRYRSNHLETAIKYLPYIVAVDEFQHRVYESPELSPAQRMEVWKELEEAYLPHRSYAGNEFLEKGGFWIRQSHIFQMPFYYIDYALAQVCAFQFWQRDLENHKEAWGDYLKLCKAGGSMSFLKLVDLANLTSPFEPDAISNLTTQLRTYLAREKESV